MTIDEARSVLQRHGWHRGMSTAGHPERAQLKDALNTLKRAGVEPTSEAPPGEASLTLEVRADPP